MLLSESVDIHFGAWLGKGIIGIKRDTGSYMERELKTETFTEITHNTHPEPMPELFEQPQLPLNLHSERRVRWINVTLERKRRLLGSKTVAREIILPDSMALQYTSIPSDEIHTLSDPQLRAALQLQDAAYAIDKFQHAPGHTSAHSVTVRATAEGKDSKLTSVTFTGREVEHEGKVIDTFTENLRRLAPDYTGPYSELF